MKYKEYWREIPLKMQLLQGHNQNLESLIHYSTICLDHSRNKDDDTQLFTCRKYQTMEKFNLLMLIEVICRLRKVHVLFLNLKSKNLPIC